MNILLVEDQIVKSELIKDFLNQEYDNPVIVHKKSLRSALIEIVNNDTYSLILLDMTLPYFDSSDDDFEDFDSESFAGKELLAQLELREINIPIIVVTQYASFQEGAVSLANLHEELKDYGKYYLGSVYFNSANDSWKNNISTLWEKRDV